MVSSVTTIPPASSSGSSFGITINYGGGQGVRLRPASRLLIGGVAMAIYFANFQCPRLRTAQAVLVPRSHRRFREGVYYSRRVVKARPEKLILLKFVYLGFITLLSSSHYKSITKVVARTGDSF